MSNQQNIGGTTVAYEKHEYTHKKFRGTTQHPEKFFVFLDWLVSLGGTFTPVWEEPSTKRTGRRDPDKKAQRYPEGFHKAYWKMQKEAE